MNGGDAMNCEKRKLGIVQELQEGGKKERVWAGSVNAARRFATYVSMTR